MNINLKAIREAAVRLEAINKLPDEKHDSLEYDEYWMPREIFDLKGQLAESAPKLLDWIERAKGIIAEYACELGQEHEDWLGRECLGCTAANLLAELKEQDQ